MDALLYWKKIWCTVTGQSNLISASEIKSVLNATKDALTAGLCRYEKYTPKSFTEWKNSRDKTAGTPAAQQLAKKLSIIMNLDTAIAWKMFCNFLMFEYHVLLDDIISSAEVEIYNSRLFEQVWLFYSWERMYFIKTWKFILETCLNENHRYNDLCTNFIRHFKFSRIRDALFRQFEYLLNEITMDNSTCCHSITDWVNRNQQEQFEILTCIILSEELEPLTISEFKEIFTIFKQHNFTNDPSSYEILEHVNPDDLKRVRILQVLTLVIGLNNLWNNLSLWKPHSDELEELVLSISYEDYLCVWLLAWSTLQMTQPLKIAIEKFNTKYHKFTKAVLREKVFVLMCNIISDPILEKETIFPAIQKSFYNLLNYICNKFTEEDSLMEHKGLIDLCIKLLKHPDIADRFLHDTGNNASMIYRVVYELFPCTYHLYSNIILQLIQHENLLPSVSQILTNFQHFTEETRERYVESVVNLMSEYCPYKCIKMEAHSEAAIFPRYGKTYIRYEVSYNFFEYSEEVMKTTLIMSNPSPEALKSVELYLRIIHGLLLSDLIDTNEVKNILDNISSVLIYISKKPNVNYPLIKICLNVFEVLMPWYGEQIIEMMVVNNFLPLVTKNPNDLNHYFDKNFINPNILLLTIGELLNSGEYDILFAYLNIVKAAPKTHLNVLRIRIPTIAFLLVHLFPLHLDLMYNRIGDKYKITLICLENLLDILNEIEPEVPSEYDKVIYDFCYAIAVNYEPTVQVLIRVFRISNTHLHTRMLKESNWKHPITFSIIECVKACLNILIKLFALNNIDVRPLQDTVLLRKFLDSNMKPSSIKILVGYLDNAFDALLPKLACQVFKKITVNPSIPVLALLEMTPYQIQSLFLEKLRDPLEEEQLKVYILQLITLCIEKQDGLTAAFFDLRQLSSKKSTNTDCDSIVTFMEEYLDNIEKSTNYLKSPVQGAILDLFHTLWMFRKDILIQQLTLGEKFWLRLTDPLFRDFQLSNRTYSQIFNIITLELYKSKGENERTKSILDKFFKKDTKYVKVWCDHIISSLNEMHIDLCGHTLQRAWKNLIMTTVIIYPDCLQDAGLRRLLAISCVEGMIEHFAQPDEIRILINCADLYLFLTKRWGNNQDQFKADRRIVISLTKVFKYVGKYYEHVTSAFKEIILSVAIQTVKDLKQFISASHGIVEEFLNAIGDIIDKEYIRIVNEDVKSTTGKLYNEWLLLLIFGKKLIAMDFVKTHAAWFTLMQFGSKVMASIGLFTEAGMIREFIGMDFETFFDATRPPRKYIFIECVNFQDALPWYYEEWWQTYTGIIHLMTILLEYMYKFRINVFFTFMTIHDDIIRNILRLPRVTAEKAALQLTSDCLHFIYKLLPWRQEWKIDQGPVYFGIIGTIYDTLNAITCIFYRPKVLTFFVADGETTLKVLDIKPVDQIVGIMNSLMQIVALSCWCLLRAGPSLLSLLTPPIKSSYINDVVIEFDFHIPQFYQEESQTITYGTILCLLNFLCKTVTTIQTPKASQSSANPTKEKEEQTTSPKEENCLVFVCPDFSRTYTSSEVTSGSTSASWLKKLNLENIICALEALGSVIAVQTYVSFNVSKLRPSLKQDFKRELCSDLISFYEFIRKRFVDAQGYRTVENIVYRRYAMRPLPYIVNLSKNEENIFFARRCRRDAFDIVSFVDDEDSEASFNTEYSREDELVDYSHIDPNIFFTARDFEDIECPQKVASDSNLIITRRFNQTNWYYGQKTLNGRVYRIGIEKVLLKYPPPPPLKDGDYLLYLMHWFTFFCGLTH
ncbi:hypothetical protein Trydic_g10775 [Trypoxylus dichotomus]